jgi:hypothetical protein
MAAWNRHCSRTQSPPVSGCPAERGKSRDKYHLAAQLASRTISNVHVLTGKCPTFKQLGEQFAGFLNPANASVVFLFGGLCL